MKYMAAVLLLVATMSAQNAPSTNKGRHLDISAIAREAKGSVVSIVMSDKEGHPITQGSGFLISNDGRIVTNYHVIKSGSSAVIKLPDGASFPVEGVLASDKHRDVAIIKVHGSNFRTLVLGDSARLQVGEEVVAIGNPLSLESTVSNGIVSAFRTDENEGGKFVQITAPISPGSSGGPLFNMAGEVVGITTAGLRGGENLNFAIPIDDVKHLTTLPRLAEARTFPDEAEDDASEQQASPKPIESFVGNAVINTSPHNTFYFANLCFFGTPTHKWDSCDVIGYLSGGTQVKAVYTEVSGQPTDTHAFAINEERINNGTGYVCEIRTEKGEEGWLFCDGIALDDNSLETRREQMHRCYITNALRANADLHVDWQDHYSASYHQLVQNDNQWLRQCYASVLPAIVGEGRQ
jgi:hypothetical protein